MGTIEVYFHVILTTFFVFLFYISIYAVYVLKKFLYHEKTTYSIFISIPDCILYKIIVFFRPYSLVVKRVLISLSSSSILLRAKKSFVQW